MTSRWFRLAAVAMVLGLTAAWIGTTLLTLVVGALTGGEALRKPPLEALREFGD